MEVHGRQPGGEIPPPHESQGEHRHEVFRSTRERIRAARELLDDLSRRRQERLRSDREMAVSDRTEDSERAQRRRSERARESRQRDTIDLSAAAETVSAHEEERARHVAEVRAAHEAGTLDSPERIERAAQRILEG